MSQPPGTRHIVQLLKLLDMQFPYYEVTMTNIVYNLNRTSLIFFTAFYWFKQYRDNERDKCLMRLTMMLLLFGLLSGTTGKNSLNFNFHLTYINLRSYFIFLIYLFKTNTISNNPLTTQNLLGVTLLRQQI